MRPPTPRKGFEDPPYYFINILGLFENYFRGIRYYNQYTRVIK